MNACEQIKQGTRFLEQTDKAVKASASVEWAWKASLMQANAPDPNSKLYLYNNVDCNIMHSAWIQCW